MVVEDDNEVPAKSNKYSDTLKTFLPYRRAPSKKDVLPSISAGLFSFLTMSWMTTLMWKAFKTGLTKEDLWELPEIDRSEHNAKRLRRIWENEKRIKKDKALFRNAIWAFGRTRFYMCIALIIISVIFQFLGPAWILKSILNFIDDENSPIEIGLALAVIAFAVQIIRNLSFGAFWIIGIHTAMRVEGAIQFMTYEKLLRLRNGSEKILSQAVVFCTNDQERIFECVAGGILALAAPVMFILSLTYSCIIIGPWALLGNLIIFLFYPIMGIVARSIGIIRRKTVKITNSRVQVTSEILNSIRLIKMYSWEESFTKTVGDLRAKEQKELRTSAFLQSLTCTFTPLTNIISSIVTFLGFSLSGNDLTAENVFTIFSIFSALQFTIGTLPFAVRSIAESSVSFSNFQKYLDLPEYSQEMNENIICDHDSVIIIQNGSFSWPFSNDEDTNPNINVVKKDTKKKLNGKNSVKESSNMEEIIEIGEDKNEDESKVELIENEEKMIKCLNNINMEIKRGKLICIAGSVGSGKSALLSALLGDVIKTEGDILIRGSLAIVTQQAWIYNGSIQENILFGLPLNKEKYEAVVSVCCLKSDIDRLPNGDQTVIGERGFNLSGGQKSRLNLARSVYSDRSIYLMDDPLSSVDNRVGKTIFESCIKGHLAEKTILLVTHDINILEQCDEVLFFRHGTLVERGAHSQLIKDEQDYYKLMQFNTRKTNENENVDGEIMNDIDKYFDDLKASPRKNRPEHLLKKMDLFKEEDEMIIKKAGGESYLLYIKSCGGYILFFIAIIVLLAFAAFQQITTVWLKMWLEAGDGTHVHDAENTNNITGYNITEYENERNSTYNNLNDNPDIGFYQGILVTIVISTVLIGLLKGFIVTRMVLHGSSSLHNKMFKRVIYIPLSFSTIMLLAGLLIDFLKTWTNVMDTRLPFFIEFVLQSAFYVLSSLIVVCVVFPALIFPMVLVLSCMIFLDFWLNIGVREAKILDNNLKTPLIHHLQSSAAGLSIIRTFHRQEIFEHRFSAHLDKHLSAEAVFRIANRWFTLRMETVGLITILITLVTSILTRGSQTSAGVGLAISNIYMVCTFVPFVMRMKSELQARFISVERILDYSQNLKSEVEDQEKSTSMDESWPANGVIKFESVSFRYADKLLLALKDINFTVNSHEKIGIVGRTGSGKTSLVAAILRLWPLESGKILIDDIDINEMKLNELRKKISVIPQDPILFHGTIRYNLDPFHEHSDEKIMDCIKKAHLENKILKDEKKLEALVESDGDNFSVGEKQLVCLARALLRGNKILILDEATGSLDLETDFLIQSTINSEFKNCTVLTIAHRLNTVSKSDRILVMDKGQVIEIGSPENLMLNSESHFYKLMAASGISNPSTRAK